MGCFAVVKYQKQTPAVGQHHLNCVELSNPTTYNVTLGLNCYI